MINHQFTLWNLAIQIASSIRVRAFERSVARGQPYQAFIHSFRRRLSIGWGWILYSEEMARWSSRANRFVLECDRNPLGQADTWRKSGSRILRQKDVPRHTRTKAVAIMVAGGVECAQKLKQYPIEGQPTDHDLELSQARIAYASGRSNSRDKQDRRTHARRTNRNRRSPR